MGGYLRKGHLLCPGAQDGQQSCQLIWDTKHQDHFLVGNSPSALFIAWIVVTSHDVRYLLESVSHGLGRLQEGKRKQVVKLLLLLYCIYSANSTRKKGIGNLLYVVV